MHTFIDWETLPFKKSSGKEKLRCPACDDRRTDKKDKSLQVDHSEGFGKCHYCDALTFRDNVSKGNKEYTLIEPVEAPLGDKIVSWVQEARGISKETLEALYVTEELHYQPAKGKEVTNIVFNYYEGEKLVNKKFRTADKKFTSTTGGKPILYNINAAIGAKELWIVEGEFDVLALREIGIKNAVSLPSGANDSDEFWSNSEPYIKDVEQFIIGVDSDEKGTEIRERIAQRLGRWRSKFVEWEGKDANDDLLSGDLERSVKNLQSFPVGGTHSVGDLFTDLLDLYKNGLPETISPKKECFGNLPKVFSVMRGHLVTVTGIPSHGKSSFTDWYLLNLIDEYKMKLSLFSPEHSPVELHLAKYAQLALGKSFFKGENQATEADLNRFKNWADEKIYFTTAENGEFPTWSWLFDKFKEQVFSFGIDVFVIDAFNKVVMDKGQEGKQAIDSVLTRLTLFAQMHNVIIFLVAHPTKMQKDKDGNYAIPSLYDVSGSADFRNQTHDGFSIYRYFPTAEQDGYNVFMNLKTKFDFQGKIGETVNFEYDLQNGRYYAIGSPQYKEDMTKPKEEQKEIQVQEPPISKELFIFDEKESDLPF